MGHSAAATLKRPIFCGLVLLFHASDHVLQKRVDRTKQREGSRRKAAAAAAVEMSQNRQLQCGLVRSKGQGFSRGDGCSPSVEAGCAAAQPPLLLRQAHAPPPVGGLQQCHEVLVKLLALDHLRCGGRWQGGLLKGWRGAGTLWKLPCRTICRVQAAARPAAQYTPGQQPPLAALIPQRAAARCARRLLAALKSLPSKQDWPGPSRGRGSSTRSRSTAHTPCRTKD